MDDIYPRVTILVWKCDYYAAEIAQLRSQKSNAVQTEANLIRRRIDLDQMKKNLEGSLQLVQQDQSTLQDVQSERQALKEQSSSLEFSVSQNQAVSEVLSLQIKSERPSINALAQFLSLINQLGIDILKTENPSITRFLNVTVKAHSSALANILVDDEVSDHLLVKTVRTLTSVVSESQKAAGKEVIAVIGSTGSGKSTTVNHLLGLQLVKDPESRHVRVADGQDEIARIGHEQTQSATYFSSVCERAGYPTFVDCGGFSIPEDSNTNLL